MKTAVLPHILTHWNLPPTTIITPIVPESVYKIGDQWVLKRVGEDTAVFQQKLQFETAVLRHLAAAGLPVVEAVLDGNGRFPTPHNGNLYALTSFVAGEPIPEDKANRNALFRSYGSTMAKLHARLATFPQADIPPKLRRTDVVDELFVRGRKLVGNGRFPQALTLLNKHEPALRPALQQLPQQLIHRDCHVGNFLSVGTQVVGVIDWEQLSFGPRLLDLAYFAMELVEHPPATPAAEARWLADVAHLWTGYCGETAVTPQEKAAFPALLLAIPFLFANWFFANGETRYVKNEMTRFSWLAQLTERHQIIKI